MNRGCVARIRPERWRRLHRGGWLLAGVSVGAALTYLFDPERGGHRRRHGREQSAGTVRHSARRLARGFRASWLQALGRARGWAHGLRRHRVTAPLDDVTLAHKVESVLFRNSSVPKGRISINAEGGTVFLRGQLKNEELIHEIVKSVQEIPDVAEVVNLLHIPGTEAPHARGGSSAGWLLLVR